MSRKFEWRRQAWDTKDTNLRHIQVWSATPKFEKEPRSWGCEAQAFSRSHVKFLAAIREVCWGVSCLDFLREILPRRSLERTNGRWPFFWSGCNFYTTKRSHGLCGWAKYTGAFKRFAMILWSANSVPLTSVNDFTACGKWRNSDKIAFRTVSDFLFGTWAASKNRVFRSTIVTR